METRVSNFVRLFKPRFAPLVESGEKPHTVRPWPKRVPKPGDRISLRTWTGAPYRSKQRVLREATIRKVEPITIGDWKIWLSGKRQTGAAMRAFARADGFSSALEMHEWFEREHGLPFSGIVIYWETDPR